MFHSVLKNVVICYDLFLVGYDFERVAYDFNFNDVFMTLEKYGEHHISNMFATTWLI